MTPPSSPSAPAPHAARPLVRETGETLRSIALALAAVLAFHAVLFQPFTIPSASMEPGLRVGDYIVVSKYPYGWSLASLSISPRASKTRLFGRDPQRGEVVVFRRPHTPGQSWIKRVIGLPGDRVRVADGQVFVNGRLLAQTPLGRGFDADDPAVAVTRLHETQPSGRRYVIHDRGPNRPGDDRAETVVPPGHYLVMGDNRDNSLDGRWPPETGVGLLPAGNLVGRAEWIVASWKPGAGLFRPWTWFNLRAGRFLKRIE